MEKWKQRLGPPQDEFYVARLNLTLKVVWGRMVSAEREAVVFIARPVLTGLVKR